MGNIPEGGELGVKFGIDERGEVQIEGYIQPRNESEFSEDELRTAYLLGCTESDTLKEDRTATQLLHE